MPFRVYTACLGVLLCTSIDSSRVEAQQAVSTSNDWASISQVLSRAPDWMLSVGSIHYEGTLSISYPDKTRLSPGDDGVRLPGSVQCWIEGDKYRYDYTPIHRLTGPAYTRTVAFDGKTHQWLEAEGGRLVTESHPAVREPTLISADLLFEPLQWLLNGSPISKFQNFPDLIDKKAWQALAQGLTLVPSVSSYNGKPVVACDLTGRIDPYTGKPCTFRIYFSSEKNFYPIAFEKLDSQNQVMLRYEIVDLGVGSFYAAGHPIHFFYPKTARRIAYGGSGDVPFKNTPYSIVNISISRLEINSNVPDDIFQIDPATATEIWDTDKQTLIEVPK